MIKRRNFSKPLPEKKIPSIEAIEYFLALEFRFRRNIIVPNLTEWGMPGIGHECDLIVLRPSGWAAEIEIKRSMADLRADKKKKHAYESGIIHELWFAVYENFDSAEVEKIVPGNAGIITYGEYVGGYMNISRKRLPEQNKNARRFTEGERQELYRLMQMRIWTMRRQMIKLKNPELMEAG